jgi:hypothetical protein
VAPLEIRRVFPAAGAPRVYHALASLPHGTVIAEFPFGSPAWELRYMYYASLHHHRLLNGYSGFFPPGYHQRVARLARIADSPEPAWQSLVDAGTTHVVLHRSGLSEQSAIIAAWLTGHGARLLGAYDDDGSALYALPR